MGQKNVLYGLPNPAQNCFQIWIDGHLFITVAALALAAMAVALNMAITMAGRKRRRRRRSVGGSNAGIQEIDEELPTLIWSAVNKHLVIGVYIVRISFAPSIVTLNGTDSVRTPCGYLCLASQIGDGRTNSRAVTVPSGQADRLIARPRPAGRGKLAFSSLNANPNLVVRTLDESRRAICESASTSELLVRCAW